MAVVGTGLFLPRAFCGYLCPMGTVIDLDAEGRIVLRTDSGRLAVLGAGDARRVR